MRFLISGIKCRCAREERTFCPEPPVVFYDRWILMCRKSFLEVKKTGSGGAHSGIMSHNNISSEMVKTKISSLITSII